MTKPVLAASLMLFMASVTDAHEGHSHASTPQKQEEIVRLNTGKIKQHLVVQRQKGNTDRPALAKLFDPFSRTVKVSSDQDFLYVESNGMPEHSMMIGITAWQQQVPMPQSYTGENAWRIPLKPVPAKNPMSAKSHFFRGAIALAVNGVPIFNPIKNDGKTDTLMAGELDRWGGHCGRADDYHYHIAPVHLEKIVGVGNPVGVALDGYPIYGYNDPNGKPPTDLDWLNGHEDENGNYHYHATKTPPYLNGGFYGEVVERNGQVDPQPRAAAVRPALSGLRGAKITGYENPQPGSYIVRYAVFGEERSVEYVITENGAAKFNFVSKRGTTSETYSLREGRGSGRRNASPPKDQGQPARGNEPMANRGRPRQGGGDPIARLLDTNRDGQIDRIELQDAIASLRRLDKDGDGKVAIEELRGPRGGGRGPSGIIASGKRPEGSTPRGQAGGANRQSRLQPSDGPRQPWILVHADEIDLDNDQVISRDEIVGEATKAFVGYDTNADSKLTQDELSVRGGSRTAMGGFLKGHAKEIDRDGDGVVTRTEAVGNAERMFAKMDRNGDGNISPQEMEAARRRQ